MSYFARARWRLTQRSRKRLLQKMRYALHHLANLSNQHISHIELIQEIRELILILFHIAVSFISQQRLGQDYPTISDYTIQ